MNSLIHRRITEDILLPHAARQCVRVYLFARARDLAGTNRLALDVPTGATTGDLRRILAEECPALRGLLERCAVAVNNELAGDSLILPVDAEVALLPPVSGG